LHYTQDENIKVETQNLAKEVEYIIEPVGKQLIAVRNGLSKCAAVVRKIPVIIKDMASTFQVKSVTSITAAEAQCHTKWFEMRQKVSKC